MNIKFIKKDKGNGKIEVFEKDKEGKKKPMRARKNESAPPH